MERKVVIGVIALQLAACAAGVARPDGSVYGMAFGQAEIRACAKDVKEEEAACTYIRGGALSQEGAKALGPVSGLLQLLTGLL